VASFAGSVWAAIAAPGVDAPARQDNELNMKKRNDITEKLLYLRVATKKK